MVSRSLALSLILASGLTSATAQAQNWVQQSLSINPQCGQNGSLFNWALEYDMSAAEVACSGGCDTTAWVDVWDYNQNGNDTLLCSLQVPVSRDHNGSGTCFSNTVLGSGAFTCDLAQYYGGAEGNELELYFVMEVNIAGICANPFWSSGILNLPQCGGGTGTNGASITCNGNRCNSAPDPLPHNATASVFWDPCGGGSYSWTARADFQQNRDRACVGGVATAGQNGGCNGGQELTGNGTWNGTGSGITQITLATDGTTASDGLTSITATCDGAGTAEVTCAGTSCITSPNPLPNNANASKTWNPCSNGAFTWVAQGQLEQGNDRVCIGGIANAAGCAGGEELTGAGPWMGSANGSVSVGVWTNGSVQSTGVTSLVATCGGMPAQASITCTGTRCSTSPNPLPNNATESRTWNPCSGGDFTWTAAGDFENNRDRVCVGGTATSGSSGGCSAGDELTGSGPWNGMASGSVSVTLATDGSVPSQGLTSLVATCDGGNMGPQAAITCTGLNCSSSPTPLPNNATAQTTWNPCSGGAFSWTAEGMFENRFDRGCVGGTATSGSSGGCDTGDELTGAGPWMGQATGAVTVSLATDGSSPSDGIMSLVATCGDGPGPMPTEVSITCNATGCQSAPSPLPNDATATAQWDPCSGGGFSWSATGQFETNSDRGCVGGTASPGSSGGCDTGDELNGAGPWMGQATGAVTVSLATDGSVPSEGMTLTLVSCDNGMMPPPPTDGADVAVRNLEVPLEGRAGETILLRFLVENVGTAEVPEGMIEVRLSTDLTIDGADRLLCTKNYDALAVGASVTLLADCEVPATTDMGNYNVIVRVDATSALTEPNEDNNTISQPIRILEREMAMLPVPPAGNSGGCTCATPRRGWSLGLLLLPLVGLLRRRKA